VDKRPEQVDKFADQVDDPRAAGDGSHRGAHLADSTRGGTLGDRRPSRPSRAVEEGRTVSYRTSSSIPERVLLRGYGLNPDDLELERIRRP